MLVMSNSPWVIGLLRAGRWGFERQIEHMKTADLGFQRSGLDDRPAYDSM